MSELLAGIGLSDYVAPERVLVLVRALVVLVAGIVLSRVLANSVSRLVKARYGRQQAMLSHRLTLYPTTVLAVMASLHQLGFELGVVLGAAGVLSVAIGFASQTSASNLISGLFLMAEQPFVVGDQLEVDGKVGEVLSIDLLSVKLRMFDNVMMRVPNEALVKSTFLNRTRFPIRRADLLIGVAYKEDIEEVRRILYDVAAKNPLALDEPAPVFIYLGYGDSALELQFSVWAIRENFLAIRNSLRLEIKHALDEAGIEIPFPHRSLYVGSQTDPFPVRMVQDGE